jgi:hypothetical protein
MEGNKQCVGGGGGRAGPGSRSTGVVLGAAGWVMLVRLVRGVFSRERFS